MSSGNPGIALICACCVQARQVRCLTTFSKTGHPCKSMIMMIACNVHALEYAST